MSQLQQVSLCVSQPKCSSCVVWMCLISFVSQWLSKSMEHKSHLTKIGQMNEWTHTMQAILQKFWECKWLGSGITQHLGLLSLLYVKGLPALGSILICSHPENSAGVHLTYMAGRRVCNWQLEECRKSPGLYLKEKFVRYKFKGRLGAMCWKMCV